MNTNEPILIVSVYQSSLSSDKNELNHEQVKNLLKSFDVPVQELFGMYKGVPEKSLMLFDSEVNRKFVTDLAIEFNQECYLYSDSNRLTDLMYQDGSKSTIGFLKPINAETAKTSQNWSFSETLNQFFGIVSK